MVKDAVRSGVGGPAYSPYLSPLKSPSYRHFLIRGEKGKPGERSGLGDRIGEKGRESSFPDAVVFAFYLSEAKLAECFSMRLQMA